MILRPETPEVFAPLWQSPRARHLGAWGGRGSAKSWDRAQAAVIYMATKPGFRLACLREVQLSLKDSSYQLIVDTIQRLDVGGLFTPVENEIRGPSGSLAIFRGMNNQNAESIKSLEGFDAAWWEEAQTATQKSIDLLIPTIRKEDSQLWWTWNPRLKTDPVDVMLRQKGQGDPDVVVVEAQWSDNPWFTSTLEKERLRALKGDPDRYAHIWEGAYEAESDMQFIGGGLVREARTRPAYADITDPVILGVDVARFGDDRSVIAIRQGKDLRTRAPIVFRDRVDTMTLASRVSETIVKHGASAVFVDEGGVGGGVVDRLVQLGHNVMGVNFGGSSDRLVPGLPKCANKRAEMWATMREWMRTGGAVPDTDEVEADLTGPLYSFDADNRILLEKKADMKKRGVASPDLGDACALTFAYPVEPVTVARLEEERAVREYDPFWS